MCAYDSNYLVFLSFSDRCGSKLNKIRITCFNRGHTNFWLKIGRCPLHSHGCPVYWNNSVIINLVLLCKLLMHLLFSSFLTKNSAKMWCDTISFLFYLISGKQFEVITSSAADVFKHEEVWLFFSVLLWIMSLSFCVNFYNSEVK